MNKVKQRIADLRKSTPKHIQWLLLIAAFLVVLILLTMMLSGRSSDAVKTDDDAPISLILKPDGEINLSDTPVGTERVENIRVAANAPVIVSSVTRTGKEGEGLRVQQTCINSGKITERVPCNISLTYAPTVASDTHDIFIEIKWYGASESEQMARTQRIKLIVGATASPAAEPKPIKKEEPAPQPATETAAPVDAPMPDALPEPESEINYDFESEEIVEPATPVREEIAKEIESIAPANPFVWPEPVSEPAPAASMSADSYAPAVETCSDFAIPGYNSAGRQIGWIKPENGGYYFHPFSDKNCDSPTGVYNPDNGIITDINGGGKKIGTDAEHIGYTAITTALIPQLSNAPAERTVNRAQQVNIPGGSISNGMARFSDGVSEGLNIKPAPKPDVEYATSDPAVVTNTKQFDRTFVLRQYKPIPATIVSDVRADKRLLEEGGTIPVIATVDRNVYSDNGRTVIVPTGTQLMGYITGKLPGPYTTVGRMEINWYQFVLPNGTEFNFTGTNDPFSADAQGRKGVPGYGSTDYIEQFFLPMVTALVPAAVNMIAPIADNFVNQIDLDNNTVVQSGTVRSSELAKNEIITAWNQVAQKLIVDMMDNTTPPFTIAAGTRITVYSPVDLQVTCGDIGSSNKKCAVAPYSTNPRRNNVQAPLQAAQDGSWQGQVRSFNLQKHCQQDQQGFWRVREGIDATSDLDGYDYLTVLYYCQSLNYQAINNARQDAVFQNQQQTGYAAQYGSVSNTTTNQQGDTILGGLSGISGNQKYNEEVLGLTYNEEGVIDNPFAAPVEESGLACDDNGTLPDQYGCCPGETYTDMGNQGFNCCPDTGGDCFPPLI